MPKLYCYDGEANALAEGGDSHAIVLDVSPEDRHRLMMAEENFRRPNHWMWIGPYVTVTDIPTGESWRVASAPCGTGCHCAAVAVKVRS